MTQLLMTQMPYPAADGRDAPLALTARETEVLRLFAQGKSSKEAALALSLSFRTVEHQIASAKRKLGARNVVHAVAIALNRRLIRAWP